MDGKGDPKGLTGDRMPLPAWSMAVADIFEALTEALAILGQMKLEGHIDPDLFDVFIRGKVYRRYGEAFRGAGQMDRVDVNRIPEFRP